MTANYRILVSCVIAITSLQAGYGQQVVPKLIRQFSDIPGVNLNVSGMQADGQGGLWLVSEDGVARFDGQKFRVLHDPVLTKGDYYYQITPVSNGRMWLKMGRGNSLSYIDVARQSIVRLPDTIRLVRDYLAKYGSNYLFADAEGNLWIGLRQHGLLKFNPKTGAVTHAVDRPLDVRGIAQDKQGIIYFTTTAHGLFVYNPQTTQLRNYHPIPNDNNSLSTDSTYGVQARNDGSVLIGMVNKANVLWPATETVRRLVLNTVPAVNPLLHSRIAMMFPDQKDNLYFTSGTATFRYTSQNATQRVALAEPTEYVGGIYVSPTNRLWVSSNGKLYEYDLNGARVVSSLIILSVDVNGTRLENNATATRNLTYDSLGHPTLTVSENDQFSVRFTPVAAHQVINNRWRMEGYEQRWKMTESSIGATSYQLSAGRYTLLVNRGLPNDTWSSETSTMTVVVVPPFWKTIPFLLFFTLIISGLGYYLVRMYVRRRQLRQQLEREQREAANLRHLDELKTRFFANISHEFRTPLTVILGLASDLKKASDQPAQAVEQSARLIERNGASLLRLVNQILDLTKLEMGEMQVTLVRADLVGFIRYVGESFDSLARSQGITLHLLLEQERCEADFDRDKLQDIIANLLANALKFTPSGGHVYCQITLREDWQPLTPQGFYESLTPTDPMANSWIQISISDTGSGIEPASLTKIFDRFYQVDHSTKGGTGIGLSLVRELVMLMEGGLAVRNRPKRGTEFVVSLPFTQQADPAEVGILRTTLVQAGRPVWAEQASTGDMPTLLLVEDNDDVAAYIYSCVGTAYQVTRAENGQEGIDVALVETPDLILSDVMMPLKDGYALCDTLKQDERTSHIPIVLLTARAALNDRLTGLRYGADAYLVKPFQREELLVVLANLLQARQKLQRHYTQLVLGTAPTPPATESAGQPLENLFLQKLREGIERQLDNSELSVEDICQLMNMSRTTLHLKLVALTGMPITTYLRLLRLRTSEDLLANSDLTIAEVAYAVGFSDPKYFSRVFREKYDQSPTDFRLSAKAEQ
ncbi:ATP-binding protein [Persicitalea sp.]|uniref:ATP-binding protein n=1 Tax=Persicitalea sp. TaxID=3100273 RepID=UPI003593495D